MSSMGFHCLRWNQYSGHWYFLDGTLRTFNESRIYCASLTPPSYIIEVNSEAENEWLTNLANHCGLPNEYWLNGNDTDNSGTFTWIDGKIQTTFTNWLPGEPSDAAGVPAECVVSATGVKGVWLDITCASTRRVVCERNF
ncbi:C-type lectin domain family 17, member A-like [Crassostrea angulata]|uniref:C-type lectin domain family 17, member A-like n=1 Tax=Magallana angulata TaxID=2784310 RepID=UPI0022B0D035|nr:C-type lectin domain family 17, member A-like [Crassostrea angulata]